MRLKGFFITPQLGKELFKHALLLILCTGFASFSKAGNMALNNETEKFSPMPLSENLSQHIEQIVKQHHGTDESKLMTHEQALDLHYAVAKQMLLLNDSLRKNRLEDAKRKDKDKQYILANSFTSFMYMMTAVGDFALGHQIEHVEFASIRALMHLLIEEGLVSDHPSFAEMMSTLHSIAVESYEGDLKMTLTNQKNKDVSMKFREPIPSPRFVIYAVMIENGATFIFSDLNAEKNRHKREEFVRDTQRSMFGFGGFVLMDSRKDNIPEFLEKTLAMEESGKFKGLKPVVITGDGFAGRGRIKGLKLPSPSTQMDSIYLLPGREGSPAFVRAKTLGFSAFVAL